MVSPENVAQYIADLRRVNASSTVADLIQKLSLMARAMAPDRDWEWLRTIYRKLARNAVPARDKRSKLVNADELYRFGIELMIEGERLAKLDCLHGALRYRDGLIIALLIARPILRRKNLQALKLGESLVKRGEHFALQISASQMKQRRAVDVLLPPELTPFVERYLAYHRPFLFPRNRNSRQPFTRDPKACQHMWVSMCGTGMASETIYKMFVRLTQAKFGKAINPHLCRDIAATSFAIEDPTHVRSGMNVLGHADYRTTEGSYNLARSLEATQRHQKNILKMRKLTTAARPESRCS
jgi:integrase